MIDFDLIRREELAKALNLFERNPSLHIDIAVDKADNQSYKDRPQHGVGKSYFLYNYLIPELHRKGLITSYCDLRNFLDSYPVIKEDKKTLHSASF